MAFDLVNIRQILAIAELRSFTRAAKMLNITQPALSRSLAAFEADFGFRIFDRNRGGVTPTAMGDWVIADAQKVWHAACGFDRNLKLYAKGEGGELTIGVGPLLASILLPSLGGDFLVKKTGITFKSIIRIPELLFKDLFDDKIELIFATDFPMKIDQDIVRINLGSLHLTVIVRASHPLAKASKSVMTKDLSDYTVAGASQYQMNGLAPKNGAFICDNYHILRDVVENTDYVWLCSPRLVEKQLQDKKMIELTVLDLPAPELPVTVSYRKGRDPSILANSLIDEVRRILEEG